MPSLKQDLLIPSKALISIPDYVGIRDVQYSVLCVVNVGLLNVLYIYPFLPMNYLSFFIFLFLIPYGMLRKVDLFAYINKKNHR